MKLTVGDDVTKSSYEKRQERVRKLIIVVNFLLCQSLNVAIN